MNIDPGGRVYNSSKSSTYVKNGKSYNNYGTGFLSIDHVNISGIAIKNQTFVELNLTSEIYQGIDYIDGVFGLGRPPLAASNSSPPFVNMINQKLIPQPVFALHVHTYT